MKITSWGKISLFTNVIEFGEAVLQEQGNCRDQYSSAIRLLFKHTRDKQRRNHELNLTLRLTTEIMKDFTMQEVKYIITFSFI